MSVRAPRTISPEIQRLTGIRDWQSWPRVQVLNEQPSSADLLRKGIRVLSETALPAIRAGTPFSTSEGDRVLLTVPVISPSQGVFYYDVEFMDIGQPQLFLILSSLEMEFSDAFLDYWPSPIDQGASQFRQFSAANYIRTQLTQQSSSSPTVLVGQTGAVPPPSESIAPTVVVTPVTTSAPLPTMTETESAAYAASYYSGSATSGAPGGAGGGISGSSSTWADSLDWPFPP